MDAFWQVATVIGWIIAGILAVGFLVWVAGMLAVVFTAKKWF